MMVMPPGPMFPSFPRDRSNTSALLAISAMMIFNARFGVAVLQHRTDQLEVNAVEHVV